MAFTEYRDYDALGLAGLVKQKQVHPAELVEEAVRQIEEMNPKLNAVINKLYEKAIQSAENVGFEGTFAGVPMLLKDITQEIEGVSITWGSKSMQTYRAKQDSNYVRLVRKTGALFVGQTNVPEFALMGITEPAYYGPTRNPWNLNHTPGGSSGGSAAAVASGMVPIAGANDGGGSIRIPAAYCGLFGLKPTRGRTPVGPGAGRNWQGASVDHILSRSVRDSAAMLDALAVQDKTAAYLAPPFEGSYLEHASMPLEKRMRFAFSVNSPIGTKVHMECKEAVYKTAKLLEVMGHQVVEVDIPVDGKRLANSYLTMYFGEVAAVLASLEEVLGRKAKFEDVEPTTWLLGLLGKTTSAEEFVLALREWDKAAYQMEDFHDRYDFYMTPTTAFPPAKISELEPRSFEKLAINLVGRTGMGGILKKAGIVDQIAQQNLARTPFTQLANLTGQPAMSIPIHLTADGLPCGVQFITSRGREDYLFRLAGELEQSNEWLKAAPPI
ncbi:6-aminohexanoate hydrolase [Bacillus sp. FJAT-27225]|uniref:amidase n=1 Tax=Bacillus sp. FJAT-27225 TaxID=1743144 RepID=UPI00080C2A80|nr:amidase family protein [Bacillus sp. FJAT-27225]OCA85766.1 6-aminohexanoate hydrolase [Bacillus sp. FJAT-27225]